MPSPTTAATAALLEPLGPPAEEVLGLLHRLPRSARVLDLGCGDGRDALPLARAGHRVTAVDRSRHTLESIRRLATREGVAVREESAAGLELVHADVRHMSPLDHYDLIIVRGLLHLLDPVDRDWVLERIRRHTRPGGWHVVSVITVAAGPAVAARPRPGALKPGELFLRYGDWDVEIERSCAHEDRGPDGALHAFPGEMVVARRPRA